METLLLKQIRTFLAINYADLVVILTLVLVLALAIRQIYKRRKTGGCASCPHAETCPGAKNTKTS